MEFLDVSDHLQKYTDLVIVPFLNKSKLQRYISTYYNTSTFRPGENDSDTEEINVQELNRKISSPQQPARKISPAHQGENKKENKNKIKATLRIIEVTLHVNVSDNDITYIWD